MKVVCVFPSSSFYAGGQVMKKSEGYTPTDTHQHYHLTMSVDYLDPSIDCFSSMFPVVVVVVAAIGAQHPSGTAWRRSCPPHPR